MRAGYRGTGREAKKKDSVFWTWVRRLSKKGVPYYIYLHAAHKDHDKGNPDPNLIALCLSCHARYDYVYKQRERRIALERLKHQCAWLQREDRHWY